jgi:sortase A
MRGQICGSNFVSIAPVCQAAPVSGFTQDSFHIYGDKAPQAINIPPVPHARIEGSTQRSCGWWLRWSRNIFFVIGVLALSYVGLTLLDTNLYQAYQSRRFQLQLRSIRPAITPASSAGALRAVALREGALGKIEIVRLGVAAMIMEGVDERTLSHAVGHVPGTPLPGGLGNAALAGHRDTFFRALRNVQHGDEITLTMLDGSYLYLVDSTQVVKPDDTQVLDDSEGSILTLVTCYPFYFVGPSPKRFIVRAHKIPG